MLRKDIYPFRPGPAALVPDAGKQGDRDLAGNLYHQHFFSRERSRQPFSDTIRRDRPAVQQHTLFPAHDKLVKSPAGFTITLCRQRIQYERKPAKISGSANEKNQKKKENIY
jgi:hypothetical protein